MRLLVAAVMRTLSGLRCRVFLHTAFFGLIGFCTTTSAEVLVRWDQDQVPSPQSLGITTLVIPAANKVLLQTALAQGYRVYIEVDGGSLTGFAPPDGIAGVLVKGKASDQQLTQIRQQLKSPGARVVMLDERGKWPHIRTNWVTRNNEVLQVTSRSSQPWIENNAALVRIASTSGTAPPLLTYAWKPITLSEIDAGPALSNYLVAVAEAGSFGADLVLPLHARLQKDLILAKPEARADWNAIRRHIEFYSWSLGGSYRPIANIGVVTADPIRSFEAMNLLLRHNLPFVSIDPAQLKGRDLSGYDLLIVLDDLSDAPVQAVSEFARNGGAVLVANATGAASSPAADRPWRAVTGAVKTDSRVTYTLGKGRVIEMVRPLADPNTFALEMRQVLGASRRVIDIWNGITVLAAPYADQDGGNVLVTALNYTGQALPVQLRIRGTFSQVSCESPEEAPVLLPYQHRNGYTEFVLPALRTGARVFLSRIP